MNREEAYSFGQSLQWAGITVQCDVIPHADWSTWQVTRPFTHLNSRGCPALVSAFFADTGRGF